VNPSILHPPARPCAILLLRRLTTTITAVAGGKTTATTTTNIDTKNEKIGKKNANIQPASGFRLHPSLIPFNALSSPPPPRHSIAN
jgi:hypothetical protein